MRALSFVALLLLAPATACGGSSNRSANADRAAPAKAPATAATPAGSNLAALPVAQYLGHDDVTGQRVNELLRASGIESSAGGSLGYSVWVSASDRAKAREILLAAAANECLAVTVFDDSAQLISGTRSARCDATQVPPAPVDHSK